MNLQLGQDGDDLQSITNMWHLVHTVAIISSPSSPSNANQDGDRLSPFEVLLPLLESMNKSPKPCMELPKLCFLLWLFSLFFLCESHGCRFSSRSKLIWPGLGGSGLLLGSLVVLFCVLVL